MNTAPVLRPMAYALAHDYLTQRGGAERVALAMTKMFPGAPLHTSVHHPEGTFSGFAEVDVRTSGLQRWGVARRDPRRVLPLLARAWDRLHIEEGVDAVVASSTGWAHAIGVPADAVKIVYCHNPARWLYQQSDYVTSRKQSLALRVLGPSLRRWDAQAASTADAYFANSRAVAGRIEQAYGIHAEVLHPPVTIDVGGAQDEVAGLEPGFFLSVARGRAYKNVRAVVDGVAGLPGARLAVVGEPPAGMGPAPHVTWLGVVSDEQLRWLYAKARALVSVSREDFGLTPLEANAFGTPSVVLRAGGFLDSTAEGVSGVFVEDETAEAVSQALRELPELPEQAISQHAQRFSAAAFAERLAGAVQRARVARGLPGRAVVATAPTTTSAVVDARYVELTTSEAAQTPR